MANRLYYDGVLMDEAAARSRMRKQGLDAMLTDKLVQFAAREEVGFGDGERSDLPEGGRWVTWEHHPVYIKDGVAHTGPNAGRSLNSMKRDLQATKIAAHVQERPDSGKVSGELAERAHKALMDKHEHLRKQLNPLLTKAALGKATPEEKAKADRIQLELEKTRDHTNTLRAHINRNSKDDVTRTAQHLVDHVNKNGDVSSAPRKGQSAIILEQHMGKKLTDNDKYNVAHALAKHVKGGGTADHKTVSRMLHAAVNGREVAELAKNWTRSVQDHKAGKIDNDMMTKINNRMASRLNEVAKRTGHKGS